MITPRAVGCKRWLDGRLESRPIVVWRTEFCVDWQDHGAPKDQFDGLAWCSREFYSWQEQIRTTWNAATALHSWCARIEGTEQWSQVGVRLDQLCGSDTQYRGLIILVVVKQSGAVLDWSGVPSGPEEDVLIQELDKVAFNPTVVQLRVRDDERPLLLQDERLTIDSDGLWPASAEAVPLAGALDQVGCRKELARAGQPSKIGRSCNVVREGTKFNELVDKVQGVASAV